MDHFALLPCRERAIVFRETAARLRLGSATIVEKDFWVCWALQRIFASTKLPGPLFKGGTSLSKVYGVIERFSEDVDIVLDRHALGFSGEQDPPNIAGTNKRNRKLDELAGKCSETVHGAVRHELQKSFRSVLGGRIGRSAKIPPTKIGRASCSLTRSALKRTCMDLAAIFAPLFGWSSDAEGTYGRRSGG
jgi:hypothetical protein